MSVTFKSNPALLSGQLPAVGSLVPDFTLVKSDLSEVSLSDFKGKKVILNIFPSLDTGVCAASVKAFNDAAQSNSDVVVLHISLDLPFAQKRFCQAEGVENSIALSAFRSTFVQDYGLELLDTPLKGLSARAVILIDENQEVLYQELVSEITIEPNYQACLATL